jgi:iron complex outermembrane receptor protein
MDNSGLDRSLLDRFSTQDLRVIYNFANRTFKSLQVIGQINNVFNTLYAPNGYSYTYISGGTQYTDNGFYPMAGRNFMIALNIRL